MWPHINKEFSLFSHGQEQNGAHPFSWSRDLQVLLQRKCPITTLKFSLWFFSLLLYSFKQTTKFMTGWVFRLLSAIGHHLIVSAGTFQWAICHTTKGGKQTSENTSWPNTDLQESTFRCPKFKGQIQCNGNSNTTRGPQLYFGGFHPSEVSICLHSFAGCGRSNGRSKRRPKQPSGSKKEKATQATTAMKETATQTL